MSIFEKIKKFIKNIGNKQKLLDTPGEILEAINIEGYASKKETKFLEDLKFDTKDLLDPRVCNGKNLVPNILRTLGVNEDIIKNPRLIEDLSLNIRRIAGQSGVEMPEFDKQPTRENINAIVDAIKTNGFITTSQDRIQKHPINYSGKSENYYGIEINQETGTVSLQHLDLSAANAYPSGNFVNESTFLPDGNGNAIENISYYKIDSDGYGETRLTNTSKHLFNPDGIVMKSEFKDYRQEDGKNILEKHILHTRDEQYPFIIQEKTILDDSEQSSPIGTKYLPMETNDMTYLNNVKWDERGNIIKFENRGQISTYYQENKETIDSALTQGPDNESDKELKQSLKAGMKKLAVKAGILPNVHEQESEINE